MSARAARRIGVRNLRVKQYGAAGSVRTGRRRGDEHGLTQRDTGCKRPM
ncbi:hypothetical protein MYA_3232 [Burkholderia sp. KJ006]|nr:hypothetical protein MYA_3232 [Burkholderia sp. KJ006]